MFLILLPHAQAVSFMHDYFTKQVVSSFSCTRGDNNLSQPDQWIAIEESRGYLFVRKICSKNILNSITESTDWSEPSEFHPQTHNLEPGKMICVSLTTFSVFLCTDDAPDIRYIRYQIYLQTVAFFFTCTSSSLHTVVLKCTYSFSINFRYQRISVYFYPGYVW